MIKVENSAPESVVDELVRLAKNMSSVTGETIGAAIEKEKNRR